MAQPEAQAGSAPQYSFYISSDLNLQVKVRLDKLTGCIPAYRNADMAPGGSVRPSALYATAILCDVFDELTVPSRTRYAEASGEGCTWDSWISFAPKYRDLGPTAQIAITIWEVREGSNGPTPLAGTTFMLFSKKGRLKSGKHTLRLYPGREGDTAYPPATPGKISVAERGPLGHVERALKQYYRGEFESMPWLDALAVKAAEETLAGGTSPADDNVLNLCVELPSFPLPVLYQDTVLPAAGALPAASAVVAGTGDALSTPLPGTSGSGVTPAAAPSFSTGAGTSLQAGSGRMILVLDPEVGKESPAEIKAQKLARSTGRGLVDTGQRPNTAERARIDAILALPPGRPLGREARELLWRFRFVLVGEGRALTRFLKCVDWGDAAEAAQASELMARWAQISVADALELLSPDYSVEAVRAHAVAALQFTTDDELLLYLLQLVQALRYEPEDESRLATFLLDRARRSEAVASAVFWYLCAELDDPTFGPRAGFVQGMLLRPVKAAASTGSDAAGSSGGGGGYGETFQGSQAPVDISTSISLQLYLLRRLKHLAEAVSAARTADRKTEAMRGLLAPGGACSDLATFECPCPLDPAVRLAGIVPSGCSVFKSKLSPLRITFLLHVPSSIPTGGGQAGSSSSGGGGGGGSTASPGSTARTLSSELPVRLASLAKNSLADKTAEHQKAFFSTVDSSQSGSATSPSHSPHEPTSQGAAGGASAAAAAGGAGSIGESSAPVPMLSLIYKRGDDLRQDQLVLQLISLMDRLLKQEHLDLRITAYQVLPTSAIDGIIEFVPASLPLSQILDQHGTVHRFLTRHHPDPKGPYGLDPEVLNNYVRSCAGYSVFTHVLGIGDRHNDNVMVTTDGRLFHIDFGYFLGRDPKFSTAPLVLSRAMVDAMGGTESQYYRRFVQLCGEAFNILRKSANLLLSLVHLMAGSSIPDIRCDPEKALLKVQERLRLELSDEEAAATMEDMLTAAQAALLHRVAEAGHRVAQRWR